MSIHHDSLRIESFQSLDSHATPSVPNVSLQIEPIHNPWKTAATQTPARVLFEKKLAITWQVVHSHPFFSAAKAILIIVSTACVSAAD